MAATGKLKACFVPDIESLKIRLVGFNSWDRTSMFLKAALKKL